MNTIFRCFVLFIFMFGCVAENHVDEKYTFKDDILKVKKVAVSFNSAPKLMSKWSDDTEPYLLLCDDFVPMSSAVSAIRFWENLGYKFGNTRVGDPLSECMSVNAPFGAIRVKLPTSDSAGSLKDRLAVTSTTKYIDTNILHSATIIIHSFALNKRYTLEHEIGHALGWGHVENIGHIMNPKWVNIGSKAYGVRKTDYHFLQDD